MKLKRALIISDDGPDGMEFSAKEIMPPGYFPVVFELGTDSSGLGGGIRGVDGEFPSTISDIEGEKGKHIICGAGVTGYTAMDFIMTKQRAGKVDLVIVGPNKGFNWGRSLASSASFAMAKRAFEEVDKVVMLGCARGIESLTDKECLYVSQMLDVMMRTMGPRFLLGINLSGYFMVTEPVLIYVRNPRVVSQHFVYSSAYHRTWRVEWLIDPREKGSGSIYVFRADDI